MRRMIDPGARAYSFSARRGGMRDSRKLDRRLQKVEQRTSPARDDNITPDEWSLVEEVDETPEVDEDIVGRIFLTRNEGSDDVFEAGITAADGEPVLVGLSTINNQGSISLVWRSLISTGLTGVTGVALDPSGNLYTQHNSATLTKRSTALASLWTAAIVGGLVETDGTTVFVSRANDVAKRLASTGGAGSPATFGSAGTGNGQFGVNGPFGMYYDGTNIWVCDPSNSRVQKFTASTGAYVSQFDGSSSGAVFTGVYEITADAAGTTLYVLDAAAGRIVKFDKATHAFIETFDLGIGTADGQIAWTAQGLAVDSVGRIWVSDTGNARINVYDSTGVFLASIGTYGSGPEQFKYPRQIAVGAGDVFYVADTSNNRVVTVQEDTGQPVIRSTTSGTVAAGNNVTVDATCLTGEYVVAGGHKHVSGNNNVNNHESYPLNSTTWRCSSNNGTAGGVATMLTCYAMCMRSR